MKKLFSVLMTIVILIMSLSCSVFALDGDYYAENGWQIRSNGMICGYDGDDADLVIPGTIHEIEVKGIESEAFSEQTQINSVTMPESLTIIGDMAFYKCISLSSVTAPGVTDIGESAFCHCKELDSVTFPELQNIGKTSFKNAGALNGFPFENLKKVPRMAFSGSDVANANLENAVSVFELAFADCDSLTSASLPKVDTNAYMGYAVFQNCSALTDVTFAESAVLLPSHTFDGCNFSSLDCFDQFEIIEHDAFANNAALTDITMKSVKYIAKSAFENCVNLTSADFPYAAEVDQEAFQGCASLTNLTLSDNVDLISYDAFDGCENLKYLLVNGPVLLYVDAFSGSSIERLEMNGLVTAHSLPIVENSIIALPSTFAECTEDTTGRNYRIYGTKGTYAESWAKENGHEFIEISQETAILKDIPTEYASGEVLSPDVIGFNRTYQWYGNTTADNTSGTPIDGATDKTFNPADYPASPYYYCVVTSTDEGYEPLEIRTGVTQNTIACEEKPDHNQPSGGHHIKDIFNSILNFLKAVFRWICSLF